MVHGFLPPHPTRPQTQRLQMKSRHIISLLQRCAPTPHLPYPTDPDTKSPTRIATTLLQPTQALPADMRLIAEEIDTMSGCPHATTDT
jgi:hypothetical protein